MCKVQRRETKEASKLRLVVSHWSTVIRNVILRPQGRRIQCDSKLNWPLRRAALAQDDTPRPPNFTSQNETQDYIQRHFSEWVTTSVAFCALCFCVILSRFEKFVIFLRQILQFFNKNLRFNLISNTEKSYLRSYLSKIWKILHNWHATCFKKAIL